MAYLWFWFIYLSIERFFVWVFIVRLTFFLVCLLCMGLLLELFNGSPPNWIVGTLMVSNIVISIGLTVILSKNLYKWFEGEILNALKSIVRWKMPSSKVADQINYFFDLQSNFSIGWAYRCIMNFGFKDREPPLCRVILDSKDGEYFISYFGLPIHSRGLKISFPYIKSLGELRLESCTIVNFGQVETISSMELIDCKVLDKKGFNRLLKILREKADYESTVLDNGNISLKRVYDEPTERDPYEYNAGYDD